MLSVVSLVVVMNYQTSVLAALLGVGLSAQPAMARTRAALSGPAEDGAVHFERGVALFTEGDYGSALYEFQLAYEVSGNFRILYNIAVCQLELHRYAEAQTSFEKYLVEGGDQIAASRKTKVRERLATLETRVGTLVITSTPSGAVVRIDGEVVGVTPIEQPHDIGPATLELSLEGYSPVDQEARVVGGESTAVDVELVKSGSSITSKPKPAPANKDVGLDPAEADRQKAAKLRLGSLITLGIGGAAGIGAIVTGSLAITTENELIDAKASTPADPGNLADIHDRKQTLALTTDVLIGVTAVALVISGGLGIAHLRLKKRASEGRNAKVELQPRLGGFAMRF